MFKTSQTAYEFKHNMSFYATQLGEETLKIIFLLYVHTERIQGDRQRLICCAGRQTDHYSRRKPRPKTHGVGAVERQN